VLDPTRRVVEVGIGTGLIALGLRERGFDVVGIEISEAMARRARRRIGPRVALADAMRLPFRDAGIEQAVSVWVLHVVADLEATVAEVARVLSPGGRYVVVPARGQHPGDPIGRAILELERRVDPDGAHSDSVERLRDAAPGAGLRVVDVRRWPAHDYLESPAEAIRKLETRACSILWRVPDDQWEAVVAPTLHTLRALPHRDEAIARRSTDDAVVLERAR
jgi:SAM-dependent methyltransferase